MTESASGRGAGLLRLAVVTVLIGVVLWRLASCGQSLYSQNALQTDAGKGSSIADQLYVTVAPVIGEVIEPTNPDQDPMARTLDLRIQDASDDNPGWGGPIRR